MVSSSIPGGSIMQFSSSGSQWLAVVTVAARLLTYVDEAEGPDGRPVLSVAHELILAARLYHCGKLHVIRWCPARSVSTGPSSSSTGTAIAGGGCDDDAPVGTAGGRHQRYC